VVQSILVSNGHDGVDCKRAVPCNGNVRLAQGSCRCWTAVEPAAALGAAPVPQFTCIWGVLPSLCVSLAVGAGRWVVCALCVVGVRRA
jgi:hypothetical protein